MDTHLYEGAGCYEKSPIAQDEHVSAHVYVKPNKRTHMPRAMFIHKQNNKHLTRNG